MLTLPAPIMTVLSPFRQLFCQETWVKGQILLLVQSWPRQTNLHRRLAGDGFKRWAAPAGRSTLARKPNINGLTWPSPALPPPCPTSFPRSPWLSISWFNRASVQSVKRPYVKVHPTSRRPLFGPVRFFSSRRPHFAGRWPRLIWQKSRDLCLIVW